MGELAVLSPELGLCLNIDLFFMGSSDIAQFGLKIGVLRARSLCCKLCVFVEMDVFLPHLVSPEVRSRLLLFQELLLLLDFEV